MKRALLLFIVLISALAVSAEDAAYNPYADANQVQDSYGQIAASLTSLRVDLTKDIVKQVNDNNDINVAALDQRISAFQREFQLKAVMGILGANIFVAGLVFYFLNKSQRGITYSSIEAKRQKEEQDRLTMVSAVNDIRSKMIYMEDLVRRGYDTSVVPANQMINQQDQNNQNSGGEKYGWDWSNSVENQEKGGWQY
jgi:hypothetical protein